MVTCHADMRVKLYSLRTLVIHLLPPQEMVVNGILIHPIVLYCFFHFLKKKIDQKKDIFPAG